MSIRRWLVSRPWPQPWLVEALLFVLLYVLPGVRFDHPCLWRAKGQLDDLPPMPE